MKNISISSVNMICSKEQSYIKKRLKNKEIVSDGRNKIMVIINDMKYYNNKKDDL